MVMNNTQMTVPPDTPRKPPVRVKLVG